MVIKNKFSGMGFEVFKKDPICKDKDKLLNLFYEMLRIRLIEEAIEKRYHEDEMKSPYSLSLWAMRPFRLGSCSVLKKMMT